MTQIIIIVHAWGLLSKVFCKEHLTAVNMSLTVTTWQNCASGSDEISTFTQSSLYA